jgi:hypothetical protein
MQGPARQTVLITDPPLPPTVYATAARRLKSHRPDAGPCPCCGAQEGDKGRWGCLHPHQPGAVWACAVVKEDARA